MKYISKYLLSHSINIKVATHIGIVTNGIEPPHLLWSNPIAQKDTCIELWAANRINRGGLGGLDGHHVNAVGGEECAGNRSALQGLQRLGGRAAASVCEERRPTVLYGENCVLGAGGAPGRLFGGGKVRLEPSELWGGGLALAHACREKHFRCQKSHWVTLFIFSMKDLYFGSQTGFVERVQVTEKLKRGKGNREY